MERERVKEVLHYSPLTGEFWWINPTCNGIKPFTKAGSIDGKGYTRITLHKKDHLAHRLAWLYVYGRPPENSLDHINGDRRIYKCKP